jgi:hypothetical protein
MLGRNRIRRIENLDKLDKLDILDLHCNQITTIGNQPRRGREALHLLKGYVREPVTFRRSQSVESRG